MASITVQCPACDGLYVAVDARGFRYFHVCPPLSSHELVTAIAAGVVVLSKKDARQLAEAQAADALDPPAPDTPSRAALVLASITILRPGHRDENAPDTPPPIPVPVDPADVPSGVVVP